MTSIDDFRVIDVRIIIPAEVAAEELEKAKKFADEQLGLYCLEAKVRAISEVEFQAYQQEGGVRGDFRKEDHRVIELSVVVWEGYVLDDLEEARSFAYDHEFGTHVLDVSSREMMDDEFEAFQACAPEFFESA
jgi:hypothetical protein